MDSARGAREHKPHLAELGKDSKMKSKRKEMDIQMMAHLLQAQVPALVEAAVRMFELETTEEEYRVQAEFYQGLAECCEAKARQAESLMAKPGTDEPEGYP
jgi:hypothetical protein